MHSGDEQSERRAVDNSVTFGSANIAQRLGSLSEGNVARSFEAQRTEASRRQGRRDVVGGLQIDRDFPQTEKFQGARRDELINFILALVAE